MQLATSLLLLDVVEWLPESAVCGASPPLRRQTLYGRTHVDGGRSSTRLRSTRFAAGSLRLATRWPWRRMPCAEAPVIVESQAGDSVHGEDPCYACAWSTTLQRPASSSCKPRLAAMPAAQSHSCTHDVRACGRPSAQMPRREFCSRNQFLYFAVFSVPLFRNPETNAMTTLLWSARR